MPRTPTPDSPDPTIDWLQARCLMRERISSQMGVCEPAVIDDLTQEGMIQLLRLVRREETRNLGGAITVVARSVAIDEIRRRQRHRLRFADWNPGDGQVEAIASPKPDGADTELLWFLMLEFFRGRKAPCHQLAQVYAEKGNWRAVAGSLDRGYEAVRQQWARCTRVFRAALQRNPGPFQDWMDGDD